MPVFVIDTNAIVGALLRQGGSSRAVLRACLEGYYQPVMGAALLAEYEDVLARDALFTSCALTPKERDDVVDAFLRCCRWVEVFYAWRPNLPDKADHHLVELGVAAQADAIVTRNVRDLTRGELKFSLLQVLDPQQCLEVYPCPR